MLVQSGAAERRVAAAAAANDAHRAAVLLHDARAAPAPRPRDDAASDESTGRSRLILLAGTRSEIRLYCIDFAVSSPAVYLIILVLNQTLLSGDGHMQYGYVMCQEFYGIFVASS